MSEKQYKFSPDPLWYLFISIILISSLIQNGIPQLIIVFIGLNLLHMCAFAIHWNDGSKEGANIGVINGLKLTWGTLYENNSFHYLGGILIVTWAVKLCLMP